MPPTYEAWEFVYRRYVWIGFHMPKKPRFPRQFGSGTYAISDGIYVGSTLWVGDCPPTLRRVRFRDLPVDVQDYWSQVMKLEQEACNPTKEQDAILDLLGTSEGYYHRGMGWNCFELDS